MVSVGVCVSRKKKKHQVLSFFFTFFNDKNLVLSFSFTFFDERERAMLPFSGFCRRFLGTMSGGEDLRSLKAIAASISLDLKRAEPRRFDGDYVMPPFIPKPQWTELGDALSQAEKYSGNNIPGNKYITLRLDGSGFSKMLPKLRRAKAFSPGYSEDFGRIMRECCISLMEQFNCLCGYTQSDEITVIIQVSFSSKKSSVLFSVTCFLTLFSSQQVLLKENKCHTQTTDGS